MCDCVCDLLFDGHKHCGLVSKFCLTETTNFIGYLGDGKRKLRIILSMAAERACGRCYFSYDKLKEGIKGGRKN